MIFDIVEDLFTKNDKVFPKMPRGTRIGKYDMLTPSAVNKIKTCLLSQLMIEIVHQIRITGLPCKQFQTIFYVTGKHPNHGFTGNFRKAFFPDK